MRAQNIIRNTYKNEAIREILANTDTSLVVVLVLFFKDKMYSKYFWYWEDFHEGLHSVICMSKSFRPFWDSSGILPSNYAKRRFLWHFWRFYEKDTFHTNPVGKGVSGSVFIPASTYIDSMRFHHPLYYIIGYRSIKYYIHI